MRAEPRDDPRPEWGKFDVERWRGSPLYRELKPGERALATCLFIWQTQKGPILHEDAEVSIAGQGASAQDVYSCLQRSGFILEGGVWKHPVAMAYYNDAVEQIACRRRGGLTRQKQAKSSQESCKESCKDSSPVPSPLVVENTVQDALITVQEQGTVPGQLALVEVKPPTREDRARVLAERYLTARALRLHGTATTKTLKAPSPGMLRDVTERMVVLLREGFDPDHLAALPALVEEAALDFMVRKDPLVLLRSDNPQGGKCHARRYEGQLAGMNLSERQVAILRNIGSLEYVKACGAKGAW